MRQKFFRHLYWYYEHQGPVQRTFWTRKSTYPPYLDIIWILNRFRNKIVFFQLDWSDGVTLTSMHSDFGRVNILLKKFHNKVKVLKNIFQLVSFKDHPVFSKTKKKARPLMPKEILHFYYVYCIKNSFCICVRVLYWQDEKKGV